MKYFGKSQLINDQRAVERLSGIQKELSMRKMNIAQLACALHLSKSVVYQWVTGFCFPNPENYNKLADFFGWPHFMEGV